MPRQTGIQQLSLLPMLTKVARQAAVLCFLFLIIGANADAHVFPDHSQPRVGSAVSTAPQTVRIWFDGALEPAFSNIMVLNSGGLAVDKKDGRVNPSDQSLLEVSLPPLPPGRYKVLWNVVARDGHKTNGDFTFTIK